MTANPPLIVGAGPAGLAAALFLAERGIRTRIIDVLTTPIRTSKALGVNPRTLSLLENSGVGPKIIAEGGRLNELHIHQNGRPLGAVVLDYDALKAKHPFVILPQSRTEALLAEALATHGIEVERGKALTALAQNADGVTVEVTVPGGKTETIHAPIVLGADGAHSATRHTLGVDFPGTAFPEDWELIDIEMEGPAPNTAWANFTADGPFIALPYDATHWRLLGFGRPLLERVPAGWKVGRELWRSAFHVSHRTAASLTVGRVCLAGDAAHIHSPMGARGMNLGIEDAWVFAECAARALAGDRDSLAAYGRSRHEIDSRVVRTVEFMTNGIRARGGMAMALRPLIVPLIVGLKPVQLAIARVATGLDHKLTVP